MEERQDQKWRQENKMHLCEAEARSELTDAIYLISIILALWDNTTVLREITSGKSHPLRVWSHVGVSGSLHPTFTAKHRELRKGFSKTAKAQETIPGKVLAQ